MKIIGIVGAEQGSECVTALKKLLTQKKQKSAVIKDSEIQDAEMLASLRQSGLDVLIVKIGKGQKNKLIDYDIIFSDGETEILLDQILTVKKGCTILLINSDIHNHVVADNVKKVNVITYGLNPKSSITASSITEESFMCSVQRKIMTCNEKEIEPCEFSVPFLTKDIYKMLPVICAFMVLNGPNF